MQSSFGQLPPEILATIHTFETNGFEAWIVGGCVRDVLLGKKPNDWDVTTNATPQQIQDLFPNTFYTNDFGTVGIVNEEASDETLRVIEVTPYRVEGKYSDARRPDTVIFSQKIEDDLKRRDFTINALAYNPTTDTLIDLYLGIQDLHLGVIKAVGDAGERFAEDALRILRAIRLVAQLDFSIEEHTKEAIITHGPQLEKVSKERIREELVKILTAPKPMKALLLAREFGILQYIIPELEEGFGVEQNQAHSYDVFEHNLRSLQHAADKGWPFHVRLAALYHDIGKPRTRKWSDEKRDWTFHGHDVVGAKITRKALEALKFSRETIQVTENLVRWHMFFSDPDKVTLSAVRRSIRNVGPENIEALIQLRMCDRIGTGRPKEQPFRLRKYQSLIEQALQDPISVNMLAIDGKRLMEITSEKPGPRLGWTLHALLEEVLDDASRNTKEYLETRAKQLTELSDTDLKGLGEEGKERKNEAEQGKIKDIRRKYFVD